MGRKSKKRGGKKGSGRGGKAAAPKQQSASELAAELRERRGKLSEMFSNEENLKGLSEDVDAHKLKLLAHATIIGNLLLEAELGGEMDEEHESLIFCQDHAEEMFADGGATFWGRWNAQVKKRKEKKEYEADLRALKEKGDNEGCLRLFRERMRSEGMEEHCKDLWQCSLVDDELFADPSPKPECPICMLTLPSREYCSYQPCCGKVLCNGCLDAQKHSGIKYDCPFCRAEIASTDEERVALTRKRADCNDPEALYMLGAMHMEGAYGVRKNLGKAHKLLGRAADLGLPAAHHSLANAYSAGRGVRSDDKKYWHHRRLAAMGGILDSRFLMGRSAYEADPPNTKLAIKHWVIAAEAGDDDSLDMLKTVYKQGLLTKESFAKALRAHKAATDEVQSKQRDESKVFRKSWFAQKAST